MWEKLTVRQIQAISKLKNDDSDPLGFHSEALSIVLDKPIGYIEELSITEFKKLLEKLDFLETEVPYKPLDYIRVGKKRYRFIKDMRELKFARYIESKEFSKDLISNLHLLAASSFVPQKRTLFGWKDEKYDSSKHQDYAEQFRDLPYFCVYSSVLFFYHVYRNWIESSKGYLTYELMKQGLEVDEALIAVTDLCKLMDGSIQPRLLQHMKVSL